VDPTGMADGDIGGLTMRSTASPDCTFTSEDPQVTVTTTTYNATTGAVIRSVSRKMPLSVASRFVSAQIRNAAGGLSPTKQGKAQTNDTGLGVPDSGGRVAGGPNLGSPSDPSAPMGSPENPIEIVDKMPTKKESLIYYHTLLDDINRRQLAAIAPRAFSFGKPVLSYITASGAVAKDVGPIKLATLAAATVAMANKSDKEIIGAKKDASPFVSERAALNAIFANILEDNKGSNHD